MKFRLERKKLGVGAIDADRNDSDGRLAPSREIRATPTIPLALVFTGQILGGKNNIIVTRTGKRFPNAKWAKWRNEQVNVIKAQLPKDFVTINAPVDIRLDYVTGDHRRRDMPAVVDAIFHVLEKAGVVADDTLLWVVISTRTYDKSNPHSIVTFI